MGVFSANLFRWGMSSSTRCLILNALKTFNYLLTAYFSVSFFAAAPVYAIENQAVKMRFVAENGADGSYIFNPGGSKKVTLSTLNWAPYIDESICGQGWVQQAVVSVFVKKGYRVEVLFLPWKRAVSMAENGQVNAVFPEYRISESAPSQVDKDILKRSLIELSKALPGGNVAFWRRKDSDIRFDGDLKKLKNVAIGVVAGYENSPEFDELMQQRYFAINTAINDWVNVKKLFMKRIDLIVGDPEVFAHQIRTNLTEKESDVYFQELETVTPILAEQPLYLAFSKLFPGNVQVREDFNLSLTIMLQSGEMKQIRDTFQKRAHLNAKCQ